MGSDDAQQDHADRRVAMVDRLQRTGRIERDSTAAALRAVPRHEFVPPDRRSAAYDDRPLPIGDGQTISAPHMVAIMTDLLELEPGDRVLEVGTGCGYHAAVTAELVGADSVFTIEYSEPLAEAARDRLAWLGYGQITVRTGDGYHGWPERAPFDGIYYTCGVPEVPDSVLDQLAPSGIVLAPEGTGMQTLVRRRHEGDDGIERESHGPVRFVRLRRD